MKIRALVLLAAVAMHTPVFAGIERFQGRVVGVHDGDTLTILVDGRDRRVVRLREVDAPECGQPGSRASKQALSGLVYGRDVDVVSDGRSYERYTAWVSVGSPALDVSASMVQLGRVWVDPRYVKRTELIALQRDRQSAGTGLWSLPASQRLPPWEWRRSGQLIARVCAE